MNEVERVLYRTNKSIREACAEIGVDFDEFPVDKIETCSHCSIWYKHHELKPDLDENPICKICWRFYGD